MSRCHSATNNDDYFPRFSRQRCGGSNRNGTLFKTYSNVRADLSSRDIPLPLCLCVKLCLCLQTLQSDGMLASARIHYEKKPGTPRGNVSYREIGARRQFSGCLAGVLQRSGCATV